jgi:hypothetical protein
MDDIYIPSNMRLLASLRKNYKKLKLREIHWRGKIAGQANLFPAPQA